MEASKLEFADLFLLDQDSSTFEVENRIMAISRIGCFAPMSDSPGEFVPGYLTLNYHFKFASFSDFIASKRGRLIGYILRILFLGGVVGFLGMTISFVVFFSQSPAIYDWADFELYWWGLYSLLGAILGASLVWFLHVRLKSSGRTESVALPEPTFSDLCIEYSRRVEAFRAAKAVTAAPASIGAHVGEDLAKSAVEKAVDAVLPAGLGRLTAEFAGDAVKGDPGEAEKETVRRTTVAAMVMELLSAHSKLTGRRSIGLTQAEFRSIELKSRRELEDMANRN